MTSVCKPNPEMVPPADPVMAGIKDLMRHLEGKATQIFQDAQCGNLVQTDGAQALHRLLEKAYVLGGADVLQRIDLAGKGAGNAS